MRDELMITQRVHDDVLFALVCLGCILRGAWTAFGITLHDSLLA